MMNSMKTRMRRMMKRRKKNPSPKKKAKSDPELN